MHYLLGPSLKHPGKLLRLSWDYFNSKRPTIHNGHVSLNGILGWIYRYTYVEESEETIEEDGADEEGNPIKVQRVLHHKIRRAVLHVEHHSYLADTELADIVGELTVTEDDLKTADGLSIFTNTAQEYIQERVARNQEVGVIPFETEAERAACLDRYASRGVSPELHLPLPPAGEHWVIDEVDLPGGSVREGNGNDYFFSCWEITNGHCDVNMVKAQLFQMDEIRKVRDKELVKLDVPFMRAVEAGDAAEQRRIAGLKQTLRDIPQTFDLSALATPEELKAAWPTELL